ncbi:response regulator transcription factor [Synechococcus sp. HJ21-Hayes]|jgi:two-component system phosphate regulon response regulator PhoB|uniref:response regulator transcription factor n=1 Tax=unclassified Synechococcus TaxID=2626047 RepID=UPI0020CE0DD7|nr:MULTISPECIES: response regulator transcription factor [unclassified Synechococcus]MCP9832532.1 response regulator transcription factor [Synechococcus sp. JJ3a-Johnson]MCP9853898.1 response regulator transcription factor [Synechococcus sp. HJ21-Hayes]
MSKVPSPPSGARLLVVEDDDTIRDTVSEAMELEGFTVTAATNGQSAWDLLRRERFDLVVMDLMLPGMNGLDLCRQLRQEPNPPLILVVSARDTETDRVLGLEVGADDYLIKPFGMRELVARCRALLRRNRSQEQAQAEQRHQVLRHADLELFSGECRVTRGDQELKLSPKEYKLLELFLQQPKRVWSREQLIEAVWGIDYIGDSKTVDVHIRWLREKIELDPSNPVHLVTVRGFGYRFG